MKKHEFHDDIGQNPKENDWEGWEKVGKRFVGAFEV